MFKLHPRCLITKRTSEHFPISIVRNYTDQYNNFVLVDHFSFYTSIVRLIILACKSLLLSFGVHTVVRSEVWLSLSKMSFYPTLVQSSRLIFIDKSFEDSPQTSFSFSRLLYNGSHWKQCFVETNYTTINTFCIYHNHLKPTSPTILLKKFELKSTTEVSRDLHYVSKMSLQV